MNAVIARSVRCDDTGVRRKCRRATPVLAPGASEALLAMTGQYYENLPRHNWMQA